MNGIIETLIYLLAIMGIIFTSMSFFEVFSNRYAETYKIFSKNPMKNKKVEVIINLKNIDETEEEEIVNRLVNGEYNNLEDIVDAVKVQKE